MLVELLPRGTFGIVEDTVVKWIEITGTRWQPDGLEIGQALPELDGCCAVAEQAVVHQRQSAHCPASSLGGPSLGLEPTCGACRWEEMIDGLPHAGFVLLGSDSQGAFVAMHCLVAARQVHVVTQLAVPRNDGSCQQLHERRLAFVNEDDGHNLILRRAAAPRALRTRLAAELHVRLATSSCHIPCMHAPTWTMLHGA
eukprot:357120-Chlamydomonas_euryale.AAC.5